MDYYCYLSYHDATKPVPQDGAVDERERIRRFKIQFLEDEHGACLVKFGRVVYMQVKIEENLPAGIFQRAGLQEISDRF